MAWIPKFIRKVFDYKSGQTLSAKEVNAILNLLVAQGDYNSEWLQYLTDSGIPEAVANMNADELKKVMTTAVKDTINNLASTITNKTSAHLNMPIVSFLNISTQIDMSEFVDLLNEKELAGTVTANAGFTDTTTAYPTTEYLKTIQRTGHAVITSGNTIAELNEATAKASTSTAKTWAQDNSITGAQKVFLYPNGNTSTEVSSIVEKVYTHTVNPALSADSIDSDMYDAHNICVVPIMELDTESIAAELEDAVANNYWVIFAVDTSAINYDQTKLEDVIGSVLAIDNIEVLNILDAIDEVENTINNRLKALEITINYLDEQGNITDDKYIHW